MLRRAFSHVVMRAGRGLPHGRWGGVAPRLAARRAPMHVTALARPCTPAPSMLATHRGMSYVLALRFGMRAQEEKRRARRAAAGTVPEWRDDGPRPVRTPSESYQEMLIPFESDSMLRKRYMSILGNIRFGMILEDLDAFAAHLAYVHADGWNPDRPLTIVTASVDRIHLLERLDPERNLVLRGRITYVGSSSMEVRVDCDASDEHGRTTPALVAYFTMVARDAKTHKSAMVPALKAETEEEVKLFEIGKRNTTRRKAASQTSLRHSAPAVEELQYVHNLYQVSKGYRVRDEDERGTVVPMDSTTQHSLILMHPESKNIHGKVFGGHLMRLAFELGYCTALSHARITPNATVVDDIYFLEPVAVGTMVDFTAEVVYTHRPTDEVLVQVDANVVDPLTGDSRTTNVFYFTFECKGLSRYVEPVSYDDAMQHIEGRRRLSLHEEECEEV